MAADGVMRFVLALFGEVPSHRAALTMALEAARDLAGRIAEKAEERLVYNGAVYNDAAETFPRDFKNQPQRYGRRCSDARRATAKAQAASETLGPKTSR